MRPSALHRLAPLFMLGACQGPVACQGLSDEGALRVVRAYDERVIEAFRAADPALLEEVAGPEEATRLTGLIGVKQDQGLTLDARLVELRLEKVQRASSDAVDVLTREVWFYRDRRIGTGEQVGQESTDRYAMRYLLRRADKRWRVDAIRFETPPEVGRSEVPNRGPASIFHGTPGAPP